MITSINHKSIGMNSLEAIGAKLTFMIIKHGTDPKLTFLWNILKQDKIMYYMHGLDDYGSNQIHIGFVGVIIVGAQIGHLDAIVGKVTFTFGIFGLLAKILLSTVLSFMIIITIFWLAILQNLCSQKLEAQLRL